MSKRMTFLAFTNFGWADADHGLWRYPQITPPRTKGELDFWIDLARTAERGRFDSLFLADAVGMGGFSPDDLRDEIHDGRMLLWDPATLIPVLAYATEHLGFVFTNSILQDHPFTFARRASTLDHLTDGRVGWNIVTSYSPNAARNYGMDELPPREERYRWAEEYVEATYALWEGSWEEGALVADVDTGAFIDPDRVHTVDYVSERYRIQGPHLTAPTMQRTPLLLQAGGSPAGRDFAARNAEVQFIASGSDEKIAADIAAVRELATRNGRGHDDIKFVISTRFIVGATDEEARRKADELDALADRDGIVAHMSQEIGIDLHAVDPNLPITELRSLVPTGGMSGVLEAMIERMPKDANPTVRDLMSSRITSDDTVGSPERIADQIERWLELGVDGLAVGISIRPGSLDDFVDHVIPILQDRGIAQREYAPGSFRQKMMGYGDRLPDSHPAARYRRG